MIDISEIGGVILAGGKASRMGFRDKALQSLHGKTLLAHVINRAKPQIASLVLSVNHNVPHYQKFGLPIVTDHVQSYAGPLLGIFSAMRWFLESEQHRDIKYLACFAADVPEFPGHVVQALARAMPMQSSTATYICHLGQIQPLFSLWNLSLFDTVEAALTKGNYGPKLLFDPIAAIAVEIDEDSPGAFFNINRLEDLQAARQRIGKKLI